jgi:hypothetical protein
MSAICIRGRHVSAEVMPIHNGYFLRASTCATNSLQPGSIIDVDNVPCIVKYLWPGEPCETETWAILLPVRRAAEPDATITA